MSDEKRRARQRAAANGGLEEAAALQREFERGGAPRLEVGRRYVIHVLPGTLLRGTILSADGAWVSLVKSEWLELTTENGSPWQLATGRPDSEVIRRSWPLADGTILATGAIAMASPCPR